MTCHITMERILPPDALPTVPSPPTAPDAPLSVAQINFLALHVRHVVERWQWLFQETLLRAFSPKASATIWRDELDDLVTRGLMARSHGASVTVTDLGRAAVEEGKADAV